MYESFRVQNFRGFDHLELNDLARVNLIAGKNNTGKTALLKHIEERTEKVTYLSAYDADITASFRDFYTSGQIDKLLNVLQAIDKRIQKITYQPDSSPFVFIDTGLRQPMPLDYMGDSLKRLTLMLVSLYQMQEGVLLIDNIEKSFHHSVYQTVSEAIADATEQWKVQVFATVYSKEFVMAAHMVYKKRSVYNLRYHRLSRDIRTDYIYPMTYDEELMDDVYETGAEMR